MCGLFGFSSYNEQPVKDISKLTNSLARQSAIRGTDATGIAFTHLGNIQIHKDAKSADKMELKHPDNVKCVIGHTRHSTQGSERKNQNNHPFSGRTKNASFALAHNGILWNDDELKKKYDIVYFGPLGRTFYQSNELNEYGKKVINKKVWAFGDLDEYNLKKLSPYKFGGVILDKMLWDKFDACRSTDYSELIKYFCKLQKIINKL